MTKNKKLLYVGAGLLLTCGIGAGAFFYLGNDSNPEDTSLEEQVKTVQMVSSVLAMTENGVVSLYDVENQTKLDTFDLKTLSKEKKKVITREVEPEPVEEVETYGDYELVEIVIKPGDSTWAVQEKLTPNENIAKMLPILEKLNEGKFLHPIYPGEHRIFLKPKDGASTQTPKEPQIITEEVVIRIPDDQPFIYYKDVENKILYAYNDYDKAVYKVVEKDGKLSADVFIQNDDFHDASRMIVENNRVWLASKDKQSIQMVSFDNTSNIKDIEVSEFTDWQVIDDTLYYTFDKMIASFDAKTGKTNEALLGDETKELVIFQDKLLALNTFGKYTDNALLYRINPDDLIVEDLVELKSDRAELLSNGNHENVYIGRMEKTETLDGEELLEPSIIGINLDKFTVDKLEWQMDYIPTTMSYSKYIYVLNDGVIEVYHEGKTTPEKVIEVEGVDLSLLP